MTAGRRHGALRRRIARSLRTEVSPGRVALVALGGLVAIGFVAPRTDAQAGRAPGSTAAGALTPQGTRVVRGRVFVAHGDGETPLAGAVVTLHRVAADSAGEVDSARTGADGRYRFRFQLGGAADAVYFVSAMRAGIAYFSSRIDPPAPGAAAYEHDTDLTVYDTTSLAVPVAVLSRHLIISAPDTGRGRAIGEVFVISNGAGITRVARGDSVPTFEASLPPDAFDVRAADGDVAADAIRVTGSRLRVLAPIPPGERRLSVTYRVVVPSDNVLTFPAAAPGGLLEVLVEDSVAAVAGAGIHEEAPTIVAGRAFRRFVAHGADSAAPSIRVTVQAGRAPGLLSPRGVVAALAVAMAVVLVAALRRTGPSTRADALAPPRPAD